MEIEMKARAVGISPITNGVFVLLESLKKDRLLVRIDMFTGRAIQMELEKITTARPLTHELIERIITELKGTLMKVVITDVVHDYALLYLEKKNSAMITSDARAGDAIAIALSVEAPIYVESAAFETLRKEDFSFDAARQREWFESLDPNDLGKKM